MGTIFVKAGEAPASAVDDFLVSARAAGHKLDVEGVGGVLQHFCSQKVTPVK